MASAPPNGRHNGSVATAQPAPASTISITVRGAAGEPIAGAAVCLVEPSGNQVAAARSASGQPIRLAVPLGRVLVADTAPEHAPKAAVLEIPPAGVELNVTLYPEDELRGTVRNADTPIANALVSLIDDTGVVVTHARTDGTGRYRMAAPVDGTYTLVAVAPGTAPAVRTLRRPHDPTVCDLALGSVARVHGVVRTPAGVPVAAAAVRLSGADGNALQEQVTAADGTFEFRGLVDGNYNVTAEGFPALSQMLTVPDPAEAGQADLVADITLTHRV
jgi:hypothetical protein